MVYDISDIKPIATLPSSLFPRVLLSLFAYDGAPLKAQTWWPHGLSFLKPLACLQLSLFTLSSIIHTCNCKFQLSLGNANQDIENVTLQVQAFSYFSLTFLWWSSSTFIPIPKQLPPIFFIFSNKFSKPSPNPQLTMVVILVFT